MASKKIDFEKSLKELSEIVERLESGECTLDESIALFEKGMQISKECSQTLQDARQKIIMLTDIEGMTENNG
ncbi:MAG: exodeoxyribonuclease VII small subunit [Ruminococcaceae bacterium]|nr:exodeoxyribonuclease VII small subunit [Oscillospiraceae bacterium]